MERRQPAALRRPATGVALASILPGVELATDPFAQLRTGIQFRIG
jgi:hypothetical protein